MKILLLAKSLSERDGQGRYALAMVNQLAKNHQLTVLASEIPDHQKSIGTEIIKLPKAETLFSPVFNLFCFWRIKKLIKQADLVHSLSDYPYCLLPAWQLKMPKPFFITIHGTYGVAPLDWGLRGKFLRRALKMASQVFCVSRYTKARVLEKIELKNLTVINNGIDFNKFSQKETKVVLKKRKKIILSVGALKERKGYHISLAAVAKAKKTYPDLKYHVVGDQTDKAYFKQLEKLVEKLGIEKEVIFQANLSDKELISLYNRSDIFLLTPVTSQKGGFEGFGLVYLEAGACGKPVIGSRECGAEDVIDDGKSGFLVPPGDVTATAEALVKLLTDTNLARQMGTNGRLKAKKMDWSKIIQEYFNIYEKFKR